MRNILVDSTVAVSVMPVMCTFINLNGYAPEDETVGHVFAPCMIIRPS